MWVELGMPKPGVTVHPLQTTWINTDHIARVEFLEENGRISATVTTTKPGGSDRSMYQGEDAEKLREALRIEREQRERHGGHPTGVLKPEKAVKKKV